MYFVQAVEGRNLVLIFLSIMAAVLVAADQISKLIAQDSLVTIGAVKEFIPGLIRFEYHENTGMAWGLMSSATWALSIITLILAALIVVIIIKYRKLAPKLLLVALALVLSGAIGNLIDRVALGYVRDFIAFDFFTFPIFNIADCCVSVGVCIMLISALLTPSGRRFVDMALESRSGSEAADDGEK